MPKDSNQTKHHNKAHWGALVVYTLALFSFIVYTYAVSVYDAAGNESGMSTPVSLPTHQSTAGDFGAVEPTIDAGARTVTIPVYNPSRRVVDVPSGSFSVPYVADMQDTEYRLTGDIVADGTAIEVTTNNITINLNGHTITYDQKAGNTSAYGVVMVGWTHRNISIFNGTIMQGDGQTPGQLVNEYGMGANPINGMSVTDFKIGGVTINYRSQDISGIFAMGSDIHVYYNTIEDQGSIVSNRHQGLAAIETRNSQGTRAYGNLVKRTRQIGIRTGADSRIYDNDITIDSYATNSAGITGWGLIYNNKVIGTGEHPIGAYISGRTDSVSFYNNYVDVQNTRLSSEYGSTGSAAFRTIWGSNLEVYDNTFIIHAENNYQGTDLMSWGRAVWVSIPEPNHKAEFRNNLIIALNTDDNAKAAGVGIVADNMSTNLVFRNNTIVSNWSNILLADSYGHADGYAHFIDNTLIKAGNASAYKTIRSQYQYRPSTAIMINNIFQEGASLEDIDLEFFGDAIKDIAIAWNVSVTVEDESSNLMVGAIVSIKNKNGKEVFSGITASDGLVKAEVIGQRITNIVDGLNTKEKNIVSEGSHTITITVAGKDPESMQANIDDNKNFTYTLGSGLDNSAPTIPTVITAQAVSSTQINLSWSASTDNVGVAGYKIYRDGALVTSHQSPVTSYTDTGLAASTTYTYTVSAYDAAGNESAQSAPVSAITFAPPDTIPPIGAVSINSGTEYANNTSVTLSLSATDTGSGMGQGAQMQFANDNINWSNPEAYAISKSWTLTNGDGIKTVYAKFKDAAGNWSSPVSDTIILDTQAPSAPRNITVR